MKNITVPGSKSISNRVLVLSALSASPTVLRNLLECDDTRFLREALTNLGVEFDQIEECDWKVTPPKKLKGNDSDNFIGNGGTPARFLVALSAIVEGEYSLRGVERMHERPFVDLFEAVKALGVGIEYLGEEGYLPVSLKNFQLSISNFQLKISGKVSSQFISGLLLATSRMDGGLEIEITDEIPSKPYVEMTVEMLRIWGVKVVVDDDFRHFSVKRSSEDVLTGPDEYHIPADCSSASYPMIYSVLSGNPICITNFGTRTLQGDEQFLEIIKKSGASVVREGAEVTILPDKEIKSLENVDFSKMPDVSMSGMVLAAFATNNRDSHFTGLESLRVKECDRIEAMVEGLRTLGVVVEAVMDEVIISSGMWIEKIEVRSQKSEEFEMKLRNVRIQIPNSELQISSHDDHRIAMVFGIIREVLRLEFEITDPNCVAKSWPDFWLELADWGGRLREVAGVIVKRKVESGNMEGGSDKSSFVGAIPCGCPVSEVLIVRKPRKDHAWQFPQGGVDEGETLFFAVQRELREECGDVLEVKFSSEEPLGVYKYFFPEDFQRHDEGIRGARVSFFHAEYISGEVEVDGEEIVEYKWVKKNELNKYFDRVYLEKVGYFL